MVQQRGLINKQINIDDLFSIPQIKEHIFLENDYELYFKNSFGSTYRLEIK